MVPYVEKSVEVIVLVESKIAICVNYLFHTNTGIIQKSLAGNSLGTLLADNFHNVAHLWRSFLC